MSEEQEPKTGEISPEPEVAKAAEPFPPSKKRATFFLKILSGAMFLLALGLLVGPFLWGLEDKKAITPDPSVLNPFLEWLGDMHVLVLHIPIGIFSYVMIMESVGLLTFRKFKPHLGAALFLSAMSGVVAVVLGYLYFLRGDYGSASINLGSRMGLHMWLSILFTIFLIFAFVTKMWSRHQNKWSPFYPLFMILAAASMTVGAHMGGKMVHPHKDIEGPMLDMLKGQPIGTSAVAGVAAGAAVAVIPDVTDTPAEDRLVYEQVVKPILYGKCWECHAGAELNPLGKKKIKGGLIMTSVADMLKGGRGGKDFPSLVPGNAEGSEIIVRVKLEKDDDDFMPTGREDEPELHLTEGEIRILEWWINNGPIDEAGDKKLAEAEGYEAILDDVKAFVPIIKEPVMKKPVAAADKKSMEAKPKMTRHEMVSKAKASVDEAFPGALIFSSRDSDDLFFTAVSQGMKFDDAALAKLKPVADAITDLDLKKTSVTDEGLKTVAEMINLKKLMLNESKITDAGLASISVLPNLESLSLFSTQIGDEGLKEIAKVASLRKVYLASTQATQGAVDELRKALPDAKIEFETPVVTVPEPAPEEEKAAE